MGGTEERIVAENNIRKWTGCFLGAAVALQFYFVQELLAALALFAIGFVAVTSVVVGLYGLQKAWEMAVTRVFSFDQVPAQGLPAREPLLNGVAVALSKSSLELKTRKRSSKDGPSLAAADWGVGQKCAERI